MKEQKSQNWFLRHKILTAILIIIVLGGIGGAMGGSSNGDNSTVTQKSQSEDKKEDGKKEDEKTEFKVGETIAFDGKEIKVISVERNWNSGNQFVQPSEGKEYLKANLYIENRSNKEISYNTFDWEFIDSKGSIEDPALMASAEDSLGSGDLVAGGKKEGSIIFEVPAGDNVKLRYSPSFWSNKNITINI